MVAIPSLSYSKIVWSISIRRSIFPATAQHSEYRGLLLLAILGLEVILVLSIRTICYFDRIEASIWPQFFVRHERECLTYRHRPFFVSFLILILSCYFFWEFRQSPNQKRS